MISRVSFCKFKNNESIVFFATSPDPQETTYQTSFGKKVLNNNKDLENSDNLMCTIVDKLLFSF